MLMLMIRSCRDALDELKLLMVRHRRMTNSSLAKLAVQVVLLTLRL